jgi:hypothetical protein
VAGQVTVRLSTSDSPIGAAVIGEDPGRVHITVIGEDPGPVQMSADPIARLKSGNNPMAFQLLTLPDETQVAAGGSAASRGYFGETGRNTYPALETVNATLDDSPLHRWRAYGEQPGRPALIVQGLFLTTQRPTPMQVYGQAFELIQALRRAGRDVWVLAFADPLAAVAAQAQTVSDAIRLASEAAGGAKVDVVGLSSGGLAARYALARDEASGGPSNDRVGVFATVDTPHQGANIHVGVQAVLWVVGGLGDRILRAPGVQNQLYQWIGATNFNDNTCQFPLNGTLQTTTAAHDAFYAEIAALNGDGYPHKSRNVAVAASAPAARAQKAGDVVYTLKASAQVLFGRVEVCREDYRARPEDVLPGSTFPGGLLPESYDAGPLRLGLETRFNPTFVPLASALDLRDGVSPFAATFTAREGLPVHGDISKEAVEFLVREITGGS